MNVILPIGNTGNVKVLLTPAELEIIEGALGCVISEAGSLHDEITTESGNTYTVADVVTMREEARAVLEMVEGHRG